MQGRAVLDHCVTVASMIAEKHTSIQSLRPILEIRGVRNIHNVVDILVSGLLA